MEEAYWGTKNLAKFGYIKLDFEYEKILEWRA